MRFLSISLVAFAASLAAAQAEPFTFTSELHVQQQVAAPEGKILVAGTFFDGTANITYTGGQAAADAFNCASWTTMAGAPYPMRTVCNFTEGASDKAAIVVGCTPTDQTGTAADCTGDLVGLAGRFANETGTVSWHQALAPDGKSGKATGKGSWNS